MIPSAIRRTAQLEVDNAEVHGALAHDAISDTDLRAGRYDGARIAIGLVDWETLERATLFHGEIGAIEEQSGQFTAQLRSAKASLEIDAVPRTSPSCRAVFCDAACKRNPAHHTHLALVASVDVEQSKVLFPAAPDPADMLHGQLRWLDGPLAGLTMHVLDVDATGLTLDHAFDTPPVSGNRALLREGCDHTIATCDARFGNAANFQGEPFLPGNDLLSRYNTSFS